MLMYGKSVSHAVVSNSLWHHGLYPRRLLCPWDFPGKNTGVGFPFLLLDLWIGRYKQKQNHSVERAISYAKLQVAKLSIDICPLKLVDTSIYKCILKWYVSQLPVGLGHLTPDSVFYFSCKLNLYWLHQAGRCLMWAWSDSSHGISLALGTIGLNPRSLHKTNTR